MNENEFLIELQAVLDKEASKGNINKSIDRLQSQINRLKLQAEIDPNSISAIKKQLEQITNQKITLSNISIDQRQTDKTGQQIGRLISDSAQREINNSGLNTDKLNADIKTLKNNLNNFASKNAGFNTFKTEINGIEVSIDSLTAKLSSVDNAADLSTLRSQAGALKTSFTELAQANKIQMQLDTGSYEAKADSIISRTMQWTDGNGNARISTDELTASLHKLTAASNEYADNKTVENQKRLISAEKELDTQLKTVTNSVRSMNAEFAKDSTIASLNSKIQTFYNNNTAAHWRYGSQLKQMLSETASGAELTTQRVREIEQSFNGVVTAARQAGKVGKSWFQSLKDSAKIFTAWTSPAVMLMKGISEIKRGVSDITALDTALVDLKKTTTMTGNQLEKFYYSSNDVAKQMGATTEEIINQASAWSRLGFSTDEQAAKMAKYSSMFKTISPGMSLDDSTDGLISVMKAFKIGLDDTDDIVDGIMSKINSIGNTQALDNNDIVEFLKRSSSAMAEANNSLDKTIALGTAAVEITRDAAKTGNALKTVSMRIRGYDEETEEYIGGIEQLSGEIADLTKTASTPGGISLFSNAAKTEYKSTKELLDGISAIYDELDDKTQARLVETLGGKNQGQIIASILNNYKTVTKSMDTMANSAGSADRELETAMDSIEVKMNTLAQTGTGIFQNLFKREDMKSALNIFTKFAEAIDVITEKLGLFRTVGLGAGLFTLIKNFGTLKQQIINISSVLNNTGNTVQLLSSFTALDAAQQKVLLSSSLLSAQQKEQCAVMSALTAADTAYTAEQLTKTTGISAETLANWGLIQSTDTLTISELAEKAASDAQAKAVLEKIIAQNAQAVANGQVTASTTGLTAAESGATVATGALTTAVRANIAAMITWLTTTPLGWFVSLAGGVFLAVKAYDLFTVSVEEQNEKMKESASAYETAKSELSRITDELEKQEAEIDILLAKDNLTYAEQGKLKELQSITKELRIQKDLAEKEEARTQKQAAKDASDLYQKQFGKYDVSEESIQQYRNTAAFSGNNVTLTKEKDNLSAMIAGYEQFNDLLKEAYGSGNQKDIDHFRSITEKLEDSIFESAQDLLEQQDSMSAYYETLKDTPYEKLTTEQKEVVDSYHAVSDAIELIYKKLKPETWNEMQIDSVFDADGIEKTKEELVEMAKSGTLDENTIQSYEKLNSALEDSRMVLEDGQTAAGALCDEMYALAEAEKAAAENAPDQEMPKIKSLSKALSQSNGTEDGTFADDIEDYKKKYHLSNPI